MKIKIVLSMIVVLGCGAARVFSQESATDRLNAESEFRWGVAAFHNSLYSKAILSFEKALTFDPQSQLYRTWLGKALYKSGYIIQALKEWVFLQAQNLSSAVLDYWINILTYRRSVTKEIAKDVRYVLSSELESSKDYYTFKRPSSIKPRRDGSFFVVAFASNEILLINPNLVLLKVMQGPILSPMKYPFDIVETDEKLFISEYKGDRISAYTLKGDYISSFAAKGTKPGQLLGPQYLAYENGYLFVTEIGNRRVSKFDTTGNFVLSFGTKHGSFPGLQEPTGIAVQNELVYVTDKSVRGIYVFDSSGNYLSTIAASSLASPEGIYFYNSSNLLISDQEKIYSLNVQSEELKQITEQKGSHIIYAVFDANHNLIAVDFNLNKVYFFKPAENLYTGYFVQIERIDTDNFPLIYLDLSVTTQDGESVIGLDEYNILVTESRVPVTSANLVYSNFSKTPLNIAFVVEKSPDMDEKTLETMARDLFPISPHITRRMVISAGETPVKEKLGSQTTLGFTQAVLIPEKSPTWRFDLGVKQAALELAPLKGKKVIIFLGSGSLGKNPYQGLSLMELTDLLHVNAIQFNAVYMDNKKLNTDLLYLCHQTRGEAYYYFNRYGIGALGTKIDTYISPVYTYSYYSHTFPDFGRKYIGVQVEMKMQNVSGRDECGYFSPLEY